VFEELPGVEQKHVFDSRRDAWRMPVWMARRARCRLRPDPRARRLMTLTRLLPTLRRSIPDPIEPDVWPHASVATTTDVRIDGLSLVRLAEVFGTPAVHVGRAAEPGTNGRTASDAAHTGVIVVRIVAASVGARGRSVTIDAGLDELAPTWREARLIGRASVARSAKTTLVTASGCLAAALDLPADLAEGDLLALPYAVGADAAAAAAAAEAASAMGRDR
jgi:hypothetical protein